MDDSQHGDPMTYEDTNKWAVGKFLTKQWFNKDGLMRVLRSVWGVDRGIKMTALNDNFFLLKFATFEDKKEILNRCLWVYGLPIGWMNQDFEINIENRIGPKIAIDMREGTGRWGDYLRIHVEITITKSLRRCVILRTNKDGQRRMCMMKYERLPTFCYACGIVGHAFEECVINGGTNDRESETHRRKHKVNRIHRICNMNGMLVVDNNTACTGLIMFWTEEINPRLIAYSTNHIDVVLSLGEDKFRFTGFYGQCQRARKHESWELLDNIGLPWFIGVDFNEILDDSEKGGARRSRVDVAAFRDAISRNILWDIRPDKGGFTWLRGCNVNIHLRERIDCFVASNDCLLILIVKCTQNLMKPQIIIAYGCTQRAKNIMGNEDNEDYFKFDNYWADEPGCVSCVQESWSGENASIHNKLSRVRAKINAWKI
ncbi:hypothetical protein F3Y22_tig00111191pilonHSYRG00128 [Hibiscus syriacus]|uniref:CCHC-type domain-containing protein n=1 Tax=Hibiscus syriacus TaxID=106335 RepID=A0A6A2YWL9_HIBSY|nr:hypothetical protein F3Y22_tig00111191pilonHSYRG00128 [Hibiscus syriacus]